MKTIKLFSFILLLVALYNCTKDKTTIASVQTYSPQFISSSSATVGCVVLSDGGSSITSCGIYLSTSQNPETTGSKLEIGNDTGTFLGKVTELNTNTQYYIKAYAINKNGKAYGEQINFTTPSTITDFDNNVYETVKIGNQTWMAENLRTTHYLNGNAINTTNPATLDIINQTSPKYQWTYDGNDTYISTYGKLYTWYVITDSRKVCPIGWHIPSDNEWSTLETTLGGNQIAANKLKEEGNTHWESPYNQDATDESCFSGLPAGYRDWNGTFFQIKSDGYWWSSTESETVRSYARTVNAGSPVIGRFGAIKSWGISVRCVKD